MKIIALFLTLAFIFAKSHNEETNSNDQYAHIQEAFERIREISGENPSFQKKIDIVLRLIEKRRSSSYNTIDCKVCKSTVGILYNSEEALKQFQQIGYDAFLKWCYATQDFAPEYCQGWCGEQAPVAAQAVFEHYFYPGFLCGELNYCEKEFKEVDVDGLITDILKGMPQHKEKLVPKQEKILNVLQLSDTHSDELYQEGAYSHCVMSECCRASSVPRNDKDGKPITTKAEYWGSMAWCDIPTRTFDQFVSFVKNYLPDIDFAVWTGDAASHNIWKQDRSDNLKHTVEQTKKLQKELPNIPFFPIFGNHESYPYNLFQFYGEKDDYMLDELAKTWAPWIGEKAAKEFKENSFYEVVLEQYNAKIILLNSQAEQIKNWTLLRNPTDPGNMLQKLRKSLQESEDNGNQPVWILAHIQVGNETRETWSRIYNAIVKRYSYIIRAQIYGHTHADSIGVFEDENGEIYNAMFVAPSLTTYHERNPSFRIFEVDAETFQIVNIKQYRLDLNYWNNITHKNVQLIWEQAYDFLSEYEIPNMYDFANIKAAREKIGSDLKFYNKYMKNFKSGVWTETHTLSKTEYCQMLSLAEDQAKCLGQPFKLQRMDWLAGPWMEKVAP